MANGQRFVHMDRGVPLKGSGFHPPDRQCLPGRLGDQRSSRGGSRRGDHRKGDRCRPGGRARRRGTSTGSATTGTLWPGRWWRATSSNAGPNAPAATTPSSRRCPAIERIGFPIAEVHADGSSVITKHPGTGGLVTVGTVTAQLLYEIGSPHYLNPDVTSLFESISLTEVGPDRVLVSGVRGEPPPPDLKVAVNYPGGYKNSMTFGIAAPAIAQKAAILELALWEVGRRPSQFATVDVRLIGRGDPGSPTNDRRPLLPAGFGDGPRCRKGRRRFSECSGRTGTFELSRFLPDHSTGRSHRLCRLLARHHPGRSGADAGGHG